ncbi:MFS transporter [Nonomuraea spiralis]|uniref:MFS transporter n=1 Tax=Nonomuraea TaxID=83681 RepID=UPI000F7A6D27|nr:MFS transporter [Nonomuraea sp. WAC 01424]RSM99545.1 MFS transporter [Nonomuraea sp. WAC 01424]
MDERLPHQSPPQTHAAGVSSTAPAPPESSGPGDRRREDRGLRRLFVTVPFVSAAAPLGYAVSAYFLALQVQAIDNAAKVENLTIVNTMSALAAMIIQPLVGVLSDRTRTRFGARAPWMLAGALIGAVGLITAGLSTTVTQLVVVMMAVQLGFNAFQGPLAAILPDRVPSRLRGRYSTLTGLGAIAAAIAGPVLASAFATRIPVGYAGFAGVILLIIVVFVVVNPDTDNRGVARPAFSVPAFLKAFWVNPLRHPDFFWAFLGRVLIFGGYYMVQTFNIYIAQEYIGLSLTEAARLVPLIGLMGLPGFIIAIAVSGLLSDRVGRRKPIVLVGGLIIAASALFPLILPSVAGLMISTVVLTIGFGVFISVDQALVSEVLPSEDDHAKDLGVINIAATLPNTIAPVAAGGIVTIFGGYAALYPVVAIVAGAGALAVLPIKRVR